LLVLSLAGGLARAEGAPDPGAPPFAAATGKIPVGAWARYRTAHFGGSGRQDLRIALVARTARQAVWELALAGIDGQPVVVALAFRRTGDGLPRVLQSRIVQVGDGPPMKMNGAGPAFRLAARDPHFRREVVTVPGGRLACQHHRVVLDRSHGFDLWIAPGVFPTGVVKFEEWTQGGNGVRLVQETWELLETGRGAKRTVTRPPRPFDQPAFARQFR
jgi:hypothetical protein